MEWVRLSELGDRRCDAVKWNVRDIAGDNNVVTIPTNGSFHFSRRLGELYPYKPYRGGAFEFGVGGYAVTDKNLNGGETVLGGQFAFGPNGFGFVINPVTYQGFYNDRDYNIIYENDEFMWEWTEPVHYYGCLDAATGYENIGGYEEIMDYIYVRVFEGEYEEPFEPQPTIAENLDRIRVAKEDIRNAIREKGVNILQEEPIQSYGGLIQQISKGNIQGTFVTFEDMYGNGTAEYFASNFGLDGFEFINVDANNYANQKWQEGRDETINNASELYITENGVYEGDLYKRVEVDVTSKISLSQTGLKLAYTKYESIPDFIDFDGVTNWFSMFYACQSLVDISKLEGITVENGSEMFVMSRIEDASITSTWNTSGSTTFSKIFQTCNYLKKIGIIDCTSITSSNTHPLYMISNSAPLTDIEGFPNMKASQTGSGFDRCPNLSHQSYINIFNSIYDFTGNGETPTSSQGKIKLHSNAFNILSDDDIAIAINKGWTITV